MEIENCRVLLTGASGGIGQELAEALADRRACIGLLGRRRDTLEALAVRLRARGADVLVLVGDITCAQDRESVLARMRAHFGGLDLLINNAGTSAFRPFAEQSAQAVERMFLTNTVAPMQLVQAALPDMLARGAGRIVNVGSTFGSIAFACFTSYSASKFALRGFSEALRRELADSGVGVTYVAPRAVRTPLNAPAVMRMAQKVGMAMDDPKRVARRILRAIEREEKDVYIGFPEALFVRVNALLPRLVDGALRRRSRIMLEFARGA